MSAQTLMSPEETDHHGSLRQRKKAATRKAIHEAAFHLAETQGLSGVTIEAISDRAGVAPRTFWAYFASKEDAVLDRNPERSQTLNRALLARPDSEDTLTALRRVLEADLSARVTDRDTAVRKGRLVRTEPHLMAAVAAMFDEIERALVAGAGARIGVDPATDLFPGVMVSTALGAIRVAFTRWSDLHGEVALPDLIEEAFGQLARGLGSLLPAAAAR